MNENQKLGTIMKELIRFSLREYEKISVNKILL